MARVSAEPPVTPEINLAPLIDITLVVLIILMVGIPIEIERLSVRVPDPTVDVPPIPPDTPQLVVAVYADGSFALNREGLDVTLLRDRLASELGPRDDKTVFVDAHGSVAYGVLVDAVDVAREAGAARVGLARLKPTGPLSPRTGTR